MTQETLIPTETKLAVSHCSARTPSGRRCRMAISDPASGLCFRHAAQLKRDRDVAARLIGDTQEFTSAVTINRSLGELYKLLARDEIAPRRGAVMAYTCSLLLRSLPAIEHEVHPQDEKHATIIMDIDSAVARRAQQARLAQEAERERLQRAEPAQRLQPAEHTQAPERAAAVSSVEPPK